MILHQILEYPLIYRAAQHVLAPGMDRIVTARLKSLIRAAEYDTVLDVACGPSSWLWKIGIQPVGLDLSHAYALRFQAAGGVCVNASAAELPFPSGCFDLVFSCALLHHLPEDLARTAVAEMFRVARAGGRIVLFDPVLPRSFWSRPLAWTLCKMDRGRFIRPQPELQALVSSAGQWNFERITHSYLGTEGVFCSMTKNLVSR